MLCANYKKKSYLFLIEMTNILIDCDPGIDDCLAILMMLNHSSNLDSNILTAITTVGGNATLEDTTKNTCSLLNFYKEQSTSDLEIDNILIGVGAPEPIEGKFNYAYEFHGENGIGIDLSKYFLKQSLLPANQIVSKIGNDFEKIDVLALGPLTNIALALKTHPQFRESVKSITIMGGSVNSPGNITPLAEFNIYNDPIAAEYIFRSEIPITLIPLNITEKVYVSKSEIPWLKFDREIPTLANDLISNWFDNYAPDDRKQFHFHDPVAIAAYLDPTLFVFEKVSVTVDCSSSKFRGQTTLLPNKGNTKLAVGVNSFKTKNLIYELLTRY